MSAWATGDRRRATHARDVGPTRAVTRNRRRPCHVSETATASARVTDVVDKSGTSRSRGWGQGARCASLSMRLACRSLLRQGDVAKGARLRRCLRSGRGGGGRLARGSLLREGDVAERARRLAGRWRGVPHVHPACEITRWLAAEREQHAQRDAEREARGLLQVAPHELAQCAPRVASWLGLGLLGGVVCRIRERIRAACAVRRCWCGCRNEPRRGPGQRSARGRVRGVRAHSSCPCQPPVAKAARASSVRRPEYR